MENLIIQELKQRSIEDGSSLANKLWILAEELMTLACEHQKRVIHVMPEFDLHDEVHLKMVLNNIANLIGNKKIHELSDVEIFMLICASYLHDCGMAPAEWDLNLMSMIENYDSTKEAGVSTSNVPISLFTHKEAKDFIVKHKVEIYKNWEGDVCSWVFSEETEDGLIISLAKVLRDYQNFRNGYISDFRKCVEKTDFEKLNNRIRIDFIRTNHHLCSSRYIINAKRTFLSKVNEAWMKGVVKDLAKVCQSHGENLSFIKKELSLKTNYQPHEAANLQFIAMMLRLGDLCHYSADRAPIVLKNGKLFHSEFSHDEWNVKNASVNYEIKDNTISFYAYCEEPHIFYKLYNYLNCIDEEIHDLCSMQREWGEIYQLNIKDVDRNGIQFDENKFRPALGKKFTLQQNKIINLLMGVGLYKEPFASLRELYQNALDACECKFYRSRFLKLDFKGHIEFGLKKENGKTFLYCLDDGIGMSEYIIENYLLKIGNSYYNSSDFYRYQALCNSDFVPTSQFGIGILSCFMIASKIEIITKLEDSNEYLACCINGPEEYFYYRTSTVDEKALIPISGTLVKLLLKEEFSSKFDDEPLEKLGLLMQYERIKPFTGEFSKYNKYYDVWQKHIYKILNDFISKTSSHVEVGCRISNGDYLKIQSKPMAFKVGDCGITDNDKNFINSIISKRVFRQNKSTLVDIQDYLVPYNIYVIIDNIEYSSIISMPLPGMPDLHDDNFLFSLLQIKGSDISVDGVAVQNNNHIDYNVYFDLLKRNGNLNFKGKNKPQLSVDRLQIIKLPNVEDETYKQIAIEAIKQIFTIAKNHIEDYKLQENVNLINLIWKYLFDRMYVADVLFINYLAKSELGQIQWPTLSRTVKDDITICNFMNMKTIDISNYDFNNFDLLTSKMVLSKLLTAEKISVDKENIVHIECTANSSYPEKDSSLRFEKYLVPVSDTSECFNEFDIVSNLYPLVPERLIKSLRRYENIDINVINSKAVCVNNYGNGYIAYFDQDSRLVHPIYGMYTVDMSYVRKRDSYIHSFENKRTSMQLMDFKFHRFHDKKGLMLLSYIAPRDLTDTEQVEIDKYKDSEPEYYNGVMNGWTILTTAMKIDNVIILSGKRSRKELVSHISKEFWEKYKDFEFRFLDGTIVNK